jgi:hypothetical protein
MADNFRPKRQSLPLEQRTLDVLLDSRDFRP